MYVLQRTPPQGAVLFHPQDYADLQSAVSYFIQESRDDGTEEFRNHMARLERLESRLEALVRTTEAPLREIASIEAVVREAFPNPKHILTSPEPIEKDGKVVYVTRAWFTDGTDKVIHVEETAEGDLKIYEVF